MRYTLLCFISLFYSLTLLAQLPNKKEKEVKVDTIPLYNGTAIGIDLLGAAWALVGQPYSNISIEASVSLKEKYHPIFELGYSIAQRTMPTGLQYKMNNGLYARMGLNYKVIGNSQNYFYVGIRYTHALFDYSYNSVQTNPNYWGKEETVSIDRQKGQSGFATIKAGLSVKISTQLSMGWNVRYELPIFVTKNDHSAPYIIPGIGIYKGIPTLGIGYSLYYHF